MKDPQEMMAEILALEPGQNYEYFAGATHHSEAPYHVRTVIRELVKNDKIIPLTKRLPDGTFAFIAQRKRDPKRSTA